MFRYVAFLRGINVSGQKKIPMDELRNLFTGIGGKAVQTYIQSGNVIFDHESANMKHLEGQLVAAIRSRYGFEVSILLKTPEQLQDIVSRNPYTEKNLPDSWNMYFVFLASVPSENLQRSLQQESFEGEACMVSNECVYLICKRGMGKARLNNNLVEKRLKVAATTRNHRTVLKVLTLCARK